ncbi:MAG: S8 family peptidase [Roseobacter sp.]
MAIISTVGSAGDTSAGTFTASFTIDPVEYAGNWGVEHIGAAEAWQDSTGEGIIVAVLDTGVDYDHTDLDANMWVNAGEIVGDGIDNDGNGFIDDVNGWNFSFSGESNNVNDVRSHGTHVAGIIGAEANGQGTVGVAPDAEIMAVKVLGDNGGGTWEAIVEGIDYAIENGAKIINMSLGGSSLPSSIFGAVQRAQDAGVIIVAAAGNSGGDQALYPAALAAQFDNVVSVANSTRNDTLFSTSNYSIDGTTVDLAAPGSSILSTTPNDNTGLKTGTSMAAPMVAGAAAVLWAAVQTASYRDIIDVIESSVDTLASLAKPVATNGVLNLSEAMQLLIERYAPQDPVNEAPALSLEVAVSELAENTADAGSVLLADLVVTDDGVGVTILALTGGDVDAFEIRDGALYLREGVSLDFDTKSTYTVEIAVDDPEIGSGAEETVTYTLTVADVDDTPVPDPEATPDMFGGLNFWYDTSTLDAGGTARLTDLSGRAPDAISDTTSQYAEAGETGLRFDGDDVYQIADDRDLNTGNPYDGKTLTFTMETGTDIDSQQMLYEQGGTWRGISIYVEGGELVMAGWNLREQVWGVLSVSTDVSAEERSTISLVFDAAAGTLSGWKDGEVFGTIDGAGLLYAHSDDIGLGGVKGATLAADGSVVRKNDAYWTGALFEAAGHGRALTALEISDLHAGLNNKWLPEPLPAGPAANTGYGAENSDTDAAGDSLLMTGVLAENGGTAWTDGDTFQFTADTSKDASVAEGQDNFDEATMSVIAMAASQSDPKHSAFEPDDPVDPVDAVSNPALINLDDAAQTYVFSEDMQDFAGRFSILNEVNTQGNTGLQEAAGDNWLTFSEDGGLTAHAEFEALYAMALSETGGLRVQQISDDTLRFEISSQRVPDVAYFQGAFVEELLLNWDMA